MTAPKDDATQSLASGAAWMYASQLLSIAVQFVYAAIVSRLVAPEDFGYYAIALLISSLAQILSVAGLGQSIARADDAGPRVRASLASYGVILGTIAFMAVSVPAPIWARLLSDSKATSCIAAIGVSVLIAPSVGLISGYLRQLGQFRLLAIVTMVATLVAQVLSLAVVFNQPTALALAVAPVLQQVVMYIGLQMCAPAPVWPGRIVRDSRSHMSFTAQATGSNVLSYVVESAPRIAVSTIAGPGALGLWNRSDVLTTIPFDKLQASFSQVMYPRFGQSLSGPTQAIWTSALLASAWISIPITAFLAGAAPTIVPIVLGNNWGSIVPIVTLLMIAAGLRGPSVLLASAVESIGRFSWVWATQAVLIVLQALAVVAIFFTHSWWPGILSVALVAISRHAIQLALSARQQLVHLGMVFRGYTEAGLAAAALFALARSLSGFLSVRDLPAFAEVAILSTGFATAATLLFYVSPRLQLGQLLAPIRERRSASKADELDEGLPL